jgi:perosamine synthetase
MWPRKQLDIGWSDLAFGLSQVVAAQSRPTERAVVGNDWLPAEEAILTLSVRSGLDLLLTALGLPAGSEMIVSAVTIPDMVRIVEHHGLVPAPVDVDGPTLQPVIENLERSITPQTRAILVAHLFGTHIDMGPIIELARQHDLLVIEDCAQAFVGSAYAGRPDSDCALFSFGPIKTATALGGAVVRVRDAALRSRMRELQNAYPIQTRSAYFKRIVKYATFRMLSKPFNYGLLVRALGMLGVDYDRALGNAAHSFAANDFFTQIRRQPSTPLLKMLGRRITGFERRGAARLRRRTMRGDQLSQAIGVGMVVGGENASHTYWVVPIRIANREAVLTALRAAGFDATSRSSLIVVPPADAASPDDSPVAPWLAETIFVPGGEDMPDEKWELLIAILLEVAFPVPSRSRAGLSEFCSVPVPL